MGFVIPKGIKEPFEQLPTGFILFNIDDCVETDLGKEGDPCFGLIVKLTAVAPDEVNGLTKDERFYWGIRPGDKRVQNGRAKADPMCALDETLLITMGRFMAFAEQAAGITREQFEGQDTDQIYSALKNRKVLAKVEHKTLPPQRGQTEGLTVSQVARWLPENCGIEPHVTDEAPVQSGKPAQAASGPLPNGAAQAAAPAPAPAPAAPAPAGRRAPSRISTR